MSTGGDPGQRGAAQKRAVKRRYTGTPIGDAAPPPTRVEVQGVGRHQSRCYDPVTGRKIERPK